MHIEDIAAGEIVRLRTGSPKMMVTAVGFAGVAPFDDTQWPNGEAVVDLHFWHDNHGFVSRILPMSFVVRAKFKTDDSEGHG